MNIVRSQLTLNNVVTTGTVECIARCRVVLDLFESSSLAGFGNKGFTLNCVLEGVDRNPQTNRAVLYTFKPKKLMSVVDLVNTDIVFKDVVGTEQIQDDVRGRDEIRAVFTLVNENAGTSVIKRSNKVLIVL